MKTAIALLCAVALPFSIAIAANSGTSTKATAGKDETFATKAAQGGMAEVAVGRLAANKADAADIKNFGQKMVDDHSAANEELKSAASNGGYSLPSDPSPSQKAAADRLSKLQGAAFDREYARMMVKDHEEDVALFRKEAQSGKDANLKAYAQKTLPTLEEHLKMARQLPGATGSTSKKE